MTPVLSGWFANVPAALDAAGHEHGARDAYVEADGTRISFADWVSRARGLAAHLAGRGVATGDVVALMLPSGIDYAVCYAAIAMAGAVTAGVNPRLGPRETSAVLAATRPSLIIRDADAGLPAAPAGVPVLA